MPTSPLSMKREINGRLYRIEVARSGPQWRARVLNQHGGPTALMPFYGATPEDAAHGLASWLTRQHKTAGDTAKP